MPTDNVEFTSTHALKTELVSLLRQIHPAKKWPKSTTLDQLVRWCHDTHPYQVETGDMGVMEYLPSLRHKLTPEFRRMIEITHYLWRNQRG